MALKLGEHIFTSKDKITVIGRISHRAALVSADKNEYRIKHDRNA